jgi:hypothetical protein
MDDLERIDLRVGIINRRRGELGWAYDMALELPEVRRRLREAADDLEYFCQEVRDIRDRAGKPTIK